METVDVHQHLLGEPLIEALARRKAPPQLIPRPDGWTFRVAAEPDSILVTEATDAELRRLELEADGIDRALVALSTALGIETLPSEEAVPLIEAHHQGSKSCRSSSPAGARCRSASPSPIPPTSTRRWRATPSASPCPPPPSPTRPRSSAWRRCSPGWRSGTRRSSSIRARSSATRPRPAAAPPHWWPALTDYVAQMQAAWFAFLHAGRPAHPRLRVLFAMLAGGAPLQLERYAARRGVPAPDPDPLTFYDTSSYGPRMIAALAAEVGAGQLVYGSDRPVVDPHPAWPDPQLRRALLATNPARLFNPDPKGALA